MSRHQAILDALREAVRLSPENGVLRAHLAAALAELGRHAEASDEYRVALALQPDNREVKLGLATSYQQQGKISLALVIVEDLINAPDAAPAVFVLYARLLAETGDEARAASMYRRAITADSAVADEELARRLGVGPTGPTAFADSEIDELGRRRASSQGSAEEPTAFLERPNITFAHVGGLESVKEDIRLKIIYPLTHAELYRAYGKSTGGGILLYGPPGCGKTYLARAVAGEIRARFLSIGISDVLDMWIGNSEKNLHSLFEQARASAPCVVFFDEVDALGASRADLRHSGARQLVNQFLSELDGVKDQNEGLLILAATNAPWQLDNAFRRPGRFDRIVFIPPPDDAGRAEILKLLCREKPVEPLDYEQLSKKTAGFSGADLKAVVDLAIEGKLRQSLKDGVPRRLSTSDLLSAARQVKPSTKDWFATARNHALYSNQSGLYDDIIKYLKL